MNTSLDTFISGFFLWRNQGIVPGAAVVPKPPKPPNPPLCAGCAWAPNITTIGLRTDTMSEFQNDLGTRWLCDEIVFAENFDVLPVQLRRQQFNQWVKWIMQTGRDDLWIRSYTCSYGCMEVFWHYGNYIVDNFADVVFLWWPFFRKNCQLKIVVKREKESRGGPCGRTQKTRWR